MVAGASDFDVVQIFCATMAREREFLGERVTAWLRARPELEVVDKAVLMSSDDEFHCLTVVVFAHRCLSSTPFGSGHPRIAAAAR